jgi:hypothetical protein
MLLRPATRLLLCLRQQTGRAAIGSWCRRCCCWLPSWPCNAGAFSQKSQSRFSAPQPKDAAFTEIPGLTGARPSPLWPESS